MCRMLAKSCKICCNKGVKTDKRLAVFAVGLRVERGLNIQGAQRVLLKTWSRAPRGARIEHSFQAYNGEKYTLGRAPRGARIEHSGGKFPWMIHRRCRAPRGARIEHSHINRESIDAIRVGLRVERGLNIHTKVAQR